MWSWYASFVVSCVDVEQRGHVFKGGSQDGGIHPVVINNVQNVYGNYKGIGGLGLIPSFMPQWMFLLVHYLHFLPCQFPCIVIRLQLIPA